MEKKFLERQDFQSLWNVGGRDYRKAMGEFYESGGERALGSVSSNKNRIWLTKIYKSNNTTLK